MIPGRQQVGPFTHFIIAAIVLSYILISPMLAGLLSNSDFAVIGYAGARSSSHHNNQQGSGNINNVPQQQHQQGSLCPDGSTPDEKGNCPSQPPSNNPSPSNNSPSQPSLQQRADGSTPDSNGNCPGSNNNNPSPPSQTPSCTDGSQPDANGNCPTPGNQQQQITQSETGTI